MAFTDMLGQYVDNRIQSAGDRMSQAYGLMTGDQNAWNQQLGLNETEEERKKRLREEARARGEVLPDDVVETTQVKTYANGSQTETTKREIPAPASDVASAATEMQPQPVEQPKPAPMLSMAEQAHEDEMSRAGQAPQPQMQPQPQMAAPQPAPQPPMAAPAAPVAPVAPQPPAPQMAAPAAPVAPVAPQAAMQPPQMPVMPQPGPGVQVAGPAQMPPPPAPLPRVEVAPAPAVPTVQAAAPAEPAWMKEANDAGTDLEKLLVVAAKYPEARGALKEKMRASVDKGRAEEDAVKLIQAANDGDLKALNKIQQALRPDTGKKKEEVTASDYIKAYMYARLGLNKLAEEAQNKIIGKDTKFGQVQLGNSNWQVEINAQGNIVRAKDDDGNVATESTLNKLRAAGIQMPKATPPSAIATRVRDDAGTEWSLVPTSQGMRFYNNEGKQGVPKGRTVPIAVGSDVLTAQQMAGVKLQYAAPTAAATAGGRIAGETATTYGTPIQQPQQLPVGPVAGVSAPGPTAAPAMGGTAAPAAPAAPQQMGRPTAAPAPTIPGVLPAPAAGLTPAQLQQRQELGTAAGKERIETEAVVEREQRKPGAQAKGKIEAKDINNQNFADSTYDLIKPIAGLIKQSTGSGIGAKVDSLAAFFGKGTEGAQATAELEPMVYPILANVPRFEGPQSDYDVKTYMKAAGDFANPEKPIKTRLAALQGMISLLKKYDKEGRNDWTFGEAQAPAASGTTSSGNKYKRVQ